jgi:cellulose synthase/poly-beta-1,6-N-acetylglucosamine synthase-like glycosyltransferase
MSCGKYVAFLDADDLWKAEKLAAQVGVLDEHPEIGLVCTDFSVISPDGTGMPSYLKNCRRAHDGYAFNEVIQEYFILTSSVVLRQSCLAEVGAFDESLKVSEDRDLWLRVCYRWKIKIVPDPLVVKRNQPGNLSSDPTRAAPYRIKLFEKLLKTLPQMTLESKKLIHNELSVNSFDIGYSYFSKGNSGEARKYLRKSLNYKWTNGKALAYLAASYLPVSVSRTLRRIKRAI